MSQAATTALEMYRTLHAKTRPLHTFIVKVASRCNLNCTYCFVYNAADSQWKRQPKRMHPRLMKQLARRIREHAEEHELADVSIVMHGGEPLLLGPRYLTVFFRIFEEQFAQSGIGISFGMQSNGLLFSQSIGDILAQHGATIGVSIDGPPRVNDLTRVDHRGLPSTSRLEEKLRLLSSPRYHSVFSGFLSVINLAADPSETLEYLSSFHPPGVDFILPYDNHDRLPPGKRDFESTEYGRWLVELFDYWFDHLPTLRVRLFDSLLRIMVGGSSTVESIGLGPVDLIVVETDGEIEAVDSLKATYDGATRLGLNIDQHSFCDAVRHPAVHSRQIGLSALPEVCKRCDIVRLCGGGYLPNRYSRARQFNNPSVYCRDLELLIRHIRCRVEPLLKQAGIATERATTC